MNISNIKHWIFIFGLNFAHCEYNIPNVKIELLPNGGVRASIPDDPAIKLFSFHGFTKSKYREKAEGDIYGESFGPKSGRWAVEDNSETVKNGDRITYYVVVQAEGKILTKKGETSVGSTETELPSTPTNPCGKTPTIVNGKSACKNTIIFEDQFGRQNANWEKEVKLGRAQPDSPFTSYESDAVQITSNGLEITASLKDYSDIEAMTGSINLLNGCTDSENYACFMNASGFNVLPPVKSGRINTKHSFNFKYGVIQVRAKLPSGYWLYPEILLEPKLRKYGSGYSSGTIVIGQASNSFQGYPVYGRALVDRFECYDSLSMTTQSSESIFKETHLYEVRWEPNHITFFFDGTEYGKVSAQDLSLRQQLSHCENLREAFVRWSSGGKMAPFDEEFHLSLGLGVAGVTNFPDNKAYKTSKPWRSRSAKAVLDFWKSRNSWKETWDGDAAKLIVESITVRSL